MSDVEVILWTSAAVIAAGVLGRLWVRLVMARLFPPRSEPPAE